MTKKWAGDIIKARGEIGWQAYLSKGRPGKGTLKGRHLVNHHKYMLKKYFPDSAKKS